MDKSQLAQELRQRQYNAGLVPRELVNALSDDDIIDSYNTCSHCGQKQVTAQNLKLAIERAENAHHYLELCDQLADVQYKEAHAVEQPLTFPVKKRAKSRRRPHRQSGNYA